MLRRLIDLAQESNLESFKSVIQKSNQRATALDNTNCCLFQNYGTAVAGNICFHDTYKSFLSYEEILWILSLRGLSLWDSNMPITKCRAFPNTNRHNIGFRSRDDLCGWNYFQEAYISFIIFELRKKFNNEGVPFIARIKCYIFESLHRLHFQSIKWKLNNE